MLDCKEGRLLRQVKREDTTMKINILLCDDDKDFLRRLTEVVTVNRCLREYRPA